MKGKTPRYLGQRPELVDWLKGMGIQSDATYRLEITIPACGKATMTVYQYARNEAGEFYARLGEAVTKMPFTVRLKSLPGIPAKGKA